MSSLSIRKLPRDLEKALLREIQRQGKTKTQVVLEALAKRFGLEHREKKREKFRRFFGKMTAKEYREFQEATKPFSQIEQELWE